MKLLDSRGLMLFMMNLEEKGQAYGALRAIGPLTSIPTKKPNPEQITEFIHFLEQNEKVCDTTGLSSTASKLALIHSHLTYCSDEVDFSSLAADCRNIRDVLMAESWNRKFVQIAEKYGEYVEQEALFGPEVKVAFPSASGDIKQAGNCLAVECGTAAVFHLMRAVEWGLRALCGHLGVMRVLKKKTPKPKYTPIAWAEWDKMLDAVHDKVDKKMLSMAAGKRKQDAQEFYYQLLRDLRGFKEAFRNHVMHTRSEYTPKEAEAVMDNVKRFMALLSSKVTE